MSVSRSMKTNHIAARASAAPPAEPVSANNNGNGHEGTEEVVSRGPQVGPSRVRVSPSIHEDVISRHYKSDPATKGFVADPIISRLADTVQVARLAAERSTRVAEAIFENVMMTVPARHRETKAKTWRIVQPVLLDLDSAFGATRRELERLEDATKGPRRLLDAGSNYLEHEVRQRLATMAPNDRAKAVSQALTDDDEMVLSAILNAPPMLTSMSATEHQMLRAQWRKRKWGDEIDRIGRLQKALDDAERAGTLLLAHVTNLSSDAVVAAAEAAEARVNAALNS